MNVHFSTYVINIVNRTKANDHRKNLTYAHTREYINILHINLAL